MILTERPPCDVAVMRSAPETPGCASHARRWVLAATVLASSLAFVVASIINVALPAIQRTYGATVGEMQWVASAYTVLLAALTLTGGAVGDRFGRRRTLQAGVAGLALASIAASLAPNAQALIAARGAQGLAAALLVPNSLALLSAAFPRRERGAAIGTWSAVTSLVGAVSPMLGGWFVDVGSWRVAFAIVLPVALVALAVTALRVPDPPILRRARPIDWLGAALVTVGLFAVVSGLIGFDGSPTSMFVLGGGIAVLIGFVRHERRTPTPMVPAELFAARGFLGVNALTFLVYLAVAGVFFVLPFDLVQVQHYSSMATGAAFLPFALLVGILSPRVGTLADRVGVRPLLVIGPTITALGLASFALPGIGGSYWTTFFAPMLLTGIGMALTVTPLTTSALACVEPAAAGIASGVNNTAARVGTVLAVAIVGIVITTSYGYAIDRRLATNDVPSAARAVVSARRSLWDVTIPESVPPDAHAWASTTLRDAFLESFRGAVLLCGAFALLGAAVAALTIPPVPAAPADEDAMAPACEHVASIVDLRASGDGCPQCVRMGDSWVHLRLCLSCGHVGCCDSSKNRHATEHFWASRHPIVRSLEPGEDWRWCYVDEIAV